MSGPTKGPWKIGEPNFFWDGRPKSVGIHDSEGWVVADVWKDGPPEHEANARLIAAAPAMLAALEARERLDGHRLTMPDPSEGPAVNRRWLAEMNRLLGEDRRLHQAALELARGESASTGRCSARVLRSDVGDAYWVDCECGRDELAPVYLNESWSDAVIRETLVEQGFCLEARGESEEGGA